MLQAGTASSTPMRVETDDYSSIKRKLIFRDTLTFLGLLLVTVVLLLITLFLFRSFASHRDDLAKRWSARGQAALSAGRPDQAIVALRTALAYAPGERSYELLLAQALGEANHIEESYNYFLSLWETQPGDGFINLNIARLAARKHDTQAAIHYYRAAIYGTWEGDGTVRRREVRLELARYLIAHHDPSSARTELLVAISNDPNDPALALSLAPLLESVGDNYDALTNYMKVLAQEPDNRTALTAAGRLQYQSGNFEEAHRLLERAAHLHEVAPSAQAALSPEAQSMLDNSARILALTPSRILPPRERVARILKARAIAKARLDNCNAQVSSSGNSSSSLQNLVAAWAGKEATLGRSALINDATEQDDTMKLVFDTEAQTSSICGAPTGDDALLLLLDKFPKTMEP
jgi:Tfp pilus assembly protein PilF